MKSITSTLTTVIECRLSYSIIISNPVHGQNHMNVEIQTRQRCRLEIKVLTLWPVDSLLFNRVFSRKMNHHSLVLLVLSCCGDQIPFTTGVARRALWYVLVSFLSIVFLSLFFSTILYFILSHLFTSLNNPSIMVNGVDSPTLLPPPAN